jgi:hypothetical protein
VWWRKAEASKHLVPLDDVAKLMEACAKLYEAGRKSAMPDIPPQIVLKPGEAADALRRLEDSGAAALRRWVATGEAQEGPTAGTGE